MYQASKKKMKLFLIAGMLLILTVISGCGGKTNYEGGNLKLTYDAGKWELSYQESEPYFTFDLYSEENEIVIMIVENDGSILESFHKDIVDLYQIDGKVTQKGVTDKWSSDSWLYYEDFVEIEDEAESLVIYAKEDEGKLLIGLAEIMVQESGEENEELLDEALEIFASMEYSEKTETGDLQQKDEHSYITYIYDTINSLLEYGAYDDAASEEETEGGQTAEEITELSDEELAAMQYIEKIAVEDYYGDQALYDAYAPKGSTSEAGFVSYYEHGLFYSAYASNAGTLSSMYDSLEYYVEYETEEWRKEYSDVRVGEIKKNGDDRYQIVSSKREDYYGTPYSVKKIYYLDMQGTGAGVIWQLEVSEISVDSETDLIIDELAKCYQIDLNEIKTGDEWLAGDQERERLQQDVYEPEEGDNVVEKLEGYQYMGLTTLTVNDGEAECQVMIPMGWRTSAQENNASSTMHGVKVSACIDMLVMQNFMSTVKMYSDGRYKSYVEDTERYSNVWKSEMLSIPGFEEASYVVITCEELDHGTQEYATRADILCFIRINEDYALDYYITLSYDEYDESTDTLIKELEKSYGIDLSKYYYENN